MTVTARPARNSQHGLWLALSTYRQTRSHTAPGPALGAVVMRPLIPIDERIKMKRQGVVLASALGLGALLQASAAFAHSACAGLPSYTALQQALLNAREQSNGGFNLDMWGTIVNRDGIVCAVAFTGADRGAQWPGSRVISAQKANTANAFSLPHLALSTANLYSAVQPGVTLYGLQHSNPVDTAAAYAGPSTAYGTAEDPLVGQKIGGVNVFGGGLALYGPGHVLLGALGVSGDSSCADHNIAWRTRHNLGMDYFGAVVGGVSGDGLRPDNIVNDIAAASLATTVDGVNNSPSGWGHPSCSAVATAIAAGLPQVSP